MIRLEINWYRRSYTSIFFISYIIWNKTIVLLVSSRKGPGRHFLTLTLALAVTLSRYSVLKFYLLTYFLITALGGRENHHPYLQVRFGGLRKLNPGHQGWRGPRVLLRCTVVCFKNTCVVSPQGLCTCHSRHLACFSLSQCFSVLCLNVTSPGRSSLTCLKQTQRVSNLLWFPFTDIASCR